MLIRFRMSFVFKAFFDVPALFISWVETLLRSKPSRDKIYFSKYPLYAVIKKQCLPLDSKNNKILHYTSRHSETSTTRKLTENTDILKV